MNVPKIGFLIENVNMLRLFQPVAHCLRTRGVLPMAVTTNATRDGVAAGESLRDSEMESVPLPDIGSLDVHLSRLAFTYPSMRRSLMKAGAKLPLAGLVVGNDQALVSGAAMDGFLTTGRPVILVQDGVRVDSRHGKDTRLRDRLHLSIRRRLMNLGNASGIYGGRGATAIAAAGEDLARRVESRCGAARRPVVTGTPGYDYLRDRLATTCTSGFADGEVPELLFVEQDLEGLSPDRLLAFFRQIVEVVCVRGDTRLVFKLHPRSVFRPSDIEAILPSDRLVVPPAQTPVSDLLRHARAVLTVYSTVGIEAVYRGVPIAVADWIGTPFYLLDPTGPLGDSIAKSPTELGRMLPLLLDDEDFRNRVWRLQRNWAESLVAPPDGEAANRIANLILETIRKEGA